jgi:hypothetical protein
MTVEDDEADGASATKAAAGDGMMEPEELADIVIEGLERESFLIPICSVKPLTTIAGSKA